MLTLLSLITKPIKSGFRAPVVLSLSEFPKCYDTTLTVGSYWPTSPEDNVNDTTFLTIEINVLPLLNSLDIQLILGSVDSQ